MYPISFNFIIYHISTALSEPSFRTGWAMMSHWTVCRYFKHLPRFVQAMWVVNTCQQHPFAEKSFSHDFFWIETPENFETETAPSFLDSLHLEEAESNTFESDAAWKYIHKLLRLTCRSSQVVLLLWYFFRGKRWNRLFFWQIDTWFPRFQNFPVVLEQKIRSNDHLCLALQRFTFFKLQTVRWNAIVYQAWYSSVVVF